MLLRVSSEKVFSIEAEASGSSPAKAVNEEKFNSLL